jgi:crotonobetainyl-CoA:carnitine CoA-transferase CaiB-like acyl-CoA transferase
VLDLGSVAMAPLAGQWLGDLGADVIKVEPPGGDSTRRVGPTTEAGMGALFLGLNRNKRSIVLDFKNESGRAALLRLIGSADVLIHNNLQHKMDALGLGPDDLLAHNPRLIYVSLRGFGRGGAYSERPAYDDIIQSMCGLASLMGSDDSQPCYVPSIVADKTTGLVGAVAILAALHRRNVTGKGGFVEVPMFESMVAFTAVEHLYGGQFEPAQGSTTYPRAATSSRRPYQTSDGYLSVLPYTDRQWKAFLLRADRRDLVDDPRFTDMTTRTRHIAEIYDVLGDILRGGSTAHWVAVCTEAEIPYAPVLSLEDLVDDAHLAETHFFQEHVDPGLGRIRSPGVPVQFDGVRAASTLPPRLGQHSREILAEVGFSEGEIAEILK